MEKQTVVMNFTHVYEECLPLEVPCHWIDCTAIEGVTRYCDEEARRTLAGLIAPYPLHGIHWIDSGDFHYMSKLWLDKMDEPFVLVVFDHHPDMQKPLCGDVLSCGNWVSETLRENRFVQHICLIGVSDGLTESIQGDGGRLTIIPEAQTATPVCMDIFDRYPLYLSLDKDVLSPEEVCTNWDQGSMSFAQLKRWLDYLFTKDVIGVDVCGEEPRVLSDISLLPQKERNREFNKALHDYFY